MNINLNTSLNIQHPKYIKPLCATVKIQSRSNVKSQLLKFPDMIFTLALEQLKYEMYQTSEKIEVTTF